MAGNSNFDAILSSTLNNYKKTLEDNVFSSRPLFAFLKGANRIRLIDGGAKIVEPLIYAVNQASASYSGYDTLPLTASGGITAAEYAWRQFASTIAISGLEEAQNSSSEQIFSLLEAKVQQAEESIAEALDEQFFANPAVGSKDFNGLAGIVEASDPTREALGNIAVSGNTWWTSYEENTAAILTSGYMTTAYNSVSRGNDTPDFIITTQTLFEKYESLLQPALRFTDNKMADAGFQNLLFKTAPIMFDTYCTAGVMYFLNSKYIKLVGHKRRWFSPTPFKLSPSQDARYSQILCYGNLTCSNRARLGKLTAKTAV